jgi:regulatory protein
MMRKGARKSAWDRLLGYLSRRDHTESEVLKKLIVHHEIDEIESAVLRARGARLFANPQVLAQQTAESLLKRGKGSRYVAGYLRTKGLPPAKTNPEAELHQAQQLVRRRFRFEPPWTMEQRQKVQRFLSSRGYSSSVVREIIAASVRGGRRD